MYPIYPISFAEQPFSLLYKKDKFEKVLFVIFVVYRVQHYGYAHGINQALVELGFKHEKMKELYKYL